MCNRRYREEISPGRPYRWAGPGNACSHFIFGPERQCSQKTSFQLFSSRISFYRPIPAGIRTIIDLGPKRQDQYLPS